MGQRSLLYRTRKNCYASKIFPQVDELVGSGIVPLRGLRTVVGVTEADQGDTAIST